MVVDSSALLAYLQKEPGATMVDAALKKGLLLSSVNRTEIIGKLVGKGVPVNEVTADLNAMTLEVVEFDLEQSDLAAHWYARRSAYDLSLGDCACLALAEARGVKVLTGERAWAKLPGLRVDVQLIRE